MVTSPTERLIGEKDGPIGWMTFNNPKRHNAVSIDMWEGIPVLLDQFDADPEIRVVVLKGAGEKAFVAGADISQFEQQRSSPDAVAYYEQIAETASRRLATVAKPTIAMIRGYCIGGGVAISLCCDLRIATESSRFAVPAAKLGLGYRHAGLQTLVSLVGPSFAREIFFTARQFTATEAHEMGLINRVVAEGDLEVYVRDYCATIAANAPLTIASVKRIVAEIIKPSGNLDEDLCRRLVQGCFDSEDYAEGRRAFMEKRKPVFRGR
jgi:enoyl-CoA hydratase/carnithine racemase